MHKIRELLETGKRDIDSAYSTWRKLELSNSFTPVLSGTSKTQVERKMTTQCASFDVIILYTPSKKWNKIELS